MESNAGHGFGVPMSMGPYAAVVIGASIGGPPALEQVLSGLPDDLPVPVAICQHMVAGATEAFALRLSQVCQLPVTEAVHGERFLPGHVYLAPGGAHTRITHHGGVSRLMVDADFADSLYVPSVDILFSSAARAYGPHVLAVVMTGMGWDGASGMLAVRESGGCTIAQTPGTSHAPSMPTRAIESGGVGEQVPLDRLASRVQELLMRHREDRS
ncbi:MAG: CheB methylesterase domain-containing protein [Actinomycetota bacterium]|jgi:two-component system chemotaxis response regulator CheB|nr:CheB methylesterase domain-containing protein [Actinomycetota bacterium]